MKKEIILGVTGSIAAYKAGDITSGLRRMGMNVTVVMTGEASHFITPLTLQSLSCNKVFSDMFEAPLEWSPVHTSLADKADLVLIAPCSANILGKLANGICDDLLTCTIISTKAKILIAPAMNDNMYKNKFVQENIKRLKESGYEFVGPINGRLACGREGMGHMAKVEDILEAAKRLLK